jgi:hypothetical protein
VMADPGAAWIEFQLLLLDAGAQIRDTIPDGEADGDLPT